MTEGATLYIRRGEDMIKKLVSHGNSYAVIIDKPVLKLLNIKSSDSFEVVTDGKNLIFSPVGDKKRQKRFQKVLEWSHEEFGETFKRLAGTGR